MKCPHCQSLLAANTARCPGCGFCEQALSSYLGDQWVRLERLTDRAHALPMADSQRLLHQMDAFERQFPQVFLAIYIGSLPPLLNPVELGMWLLNHGAFSTHQFAKRNEYGMVCTLDPAAQRFGFAVGYALEKVLPEPTLERISLEMKEHLAQGHLAAALEGLLARLERIYRRHGQPQSAQLEEAILPGRAGNPRDFGLTPLRQGHQSKAPTETSSPHHS
ncbi:MAG: hypothetical protein KDK99_02915 [Verrucomicrobiales bacterium]|nr:hypothetical protein [Verrucomicrobiales bacterium]